MTKLWRCSKPFVLFAALLISSTACATTSMGGSGRTHPEFTKSAGMSLRAGYDREVIMDLFGQPDRTEMSTCGTATDNPWQCLIWEYDLPPDSRGKYQYNPNTNRFLFQSNGALNSWSTNLLYPDPDYHPVRRAQACSAPDSPIVYAGTALSCFLYLLVEGDYSGASQWFGTASVSLADRDEEESTLARMQVLQCLLISGDPPACYQNRGSTEFSYAIMGEYQDGVRAHVIVNDGRVIPVKLVETEQGGWRVEKLSIPAMLTGT